jgi:Tfp pilus assembly protein PilF
VPNTVLRPKRKEILMPILVCRLAFAFVLGLATFAATANPNPSPDGPDVSSVRAAIDAKDYHAALAKLKEIEITSQHPDVYSLMGFALRKTGDRAQAMTYYRKALDADPSHKGALEYQGELFVELGQIDNAKANLAKLEDVCAEGCEEEDDLKEAIEHASAAK